MPECGAGGSGYTASMSDTAPQPRSIDWNQVEADYRAGIKPLRLIGQEQGVTHGRIAQVAKQRGWERDLKAKIAARAEAKLSKAAVSAELTAARMVTEKQVVEANAEAQMRIRLAHRTDIAAVRNLCMGLFAELEAESQPEQRQALESLGELLRAPDQRGMDKLNDVYRAVISLPERTKTLKALTESLKMLVALEREAFGIASIEPPANAADPAAVLAALADKLPD